MLLVRMIKFYLPDLHSLSILVLKRTGFYDSQEVLDNAAKMENMRISERYWGGGGGNGKREGGSNTGRVRVNTMYAKFLGYGRKGFTSRDRNVRDENLDLNNLRILGNKCGRRDTFTTWRTS